MREDVMIEPMTEEFLLWRCLHDGPLSQANIDQWPPASKIPYQRYRLRNTPLLQKLTKTYGACAIIAHTNGRIVGKLRFYPRAVCDMEGAGHLCLQQDFPAGPKDDFADSSFPDLASIKDKTLVVHCMMTGSSLQKENPFQRKGIGTLMAENLISWAGANGWEHIEADSFEDIPIIYEITGSAGHTFWEKLGFYLADRHPHPHLQNRSSFVLTLEEQAASLGIPPAKARDQLIMRFDLK